VLALFTEEQAYLRDVVGDLARKIGIQNRNDLDTADRERGWSEIRSMGLLGLRAREGGRPVASGVEATIAAEALAGRLVPQPYLGVALLPSELLALAGAPADLQTAVSSGEQRACILMATELGAPSAPPHAKAVAWDCEGAELALGIEAASGTVSRHAINTFEPLDAADLTRTVAAVTTGPIQDSWTIAPGDLERWHAFALVVVSADIVGAMRGALAGAVDYTKERVQFGAPVGSFQAVQHLCSDAHVQIEGAASALRYAAWAVDVLDGGEALLAARTAKALAAGAARDVGETVMQVYGGIGQTWEQIAHVFLRRQMLSSQVLGGASAQLRAIADARLGAA
jgi:acyl-CoA dehydrogenase-like protein